MTTFPMHDDSSRQSVSSVQDALEKILNSTRGILPGSYLLEATAYFRAFNTGDANFYWTKSEDGGLTCPSFGDGTKSILSYDQVLQELETYSQRLVSGENQINMIFTTSWLRRPLERFRVLPSGLLCRAVIENSSSRTARYYIQVVALSAVKVHKLWASYINEFVYVSLIASQQHISKHKGTRV